MKILEQLNPNNTVSFNRPIAHALGLNAAVVYSALIAKQEYYHKRGMLDGEGFFYSTVADLEESTSMSKCQQSNAIKVLTEAGLVECRKRGMPARRCFRVIDNAELLNAFLEQGEDAMTALNPISQKPNENAPTCRAETERPVGGFSDDKSAQNEPYNINPNIIKSKESNPYPPIESGGSIDVTDNSERIIPADMRSEYRGIIRDNIAYDCFEDKTQVDELVEIMLDVVCSGKSTVRVHGEELPHEAVKSRYLKLNHEHIDYLLLAMERNTSSVKNIRAYLITALYNAPTTMDAYFRALVNHDMYGADNSGGNCFPSAERAFFP
ncbi:MAG: DUF6017 domain-containing protein [Oscillospiraceae bacterium]